MTHPTIYKKSKTGAIVYCKISVNDNIITVETGQVGTDKPTFHTTTCSPKNIGRSNETTGPQQARLEANSKLAKKLKSGYTTNTSGESNIRLPMKVKVYQDQIANVDFPCYISPKLNGVNITIRLDNMHTVYTSRGGELRPSLPHVEDDLIELMTTYGIDEINAEIYKHGEFLQDIQAATTKLNDLSKSLQIHIFDLPNVPGTYYDRLKILNDIDNTFSMDNVSIIPIYSNIMDHEQIYRLYQTFVEQGFEGAVIRNPSGLYQHNVRSSDVFKLKEAQDAEFEVVDFALDKHSHPIFVCKTTSGNTFKVKPKGTNDQRLALANIANTKIGKWLKVEFETLSKNGTPQKPVGLCFRNCDSAGNPTE